MGVPLYSSCVLFGSLVLFFSIYYFYQSKKKIKNLCLGQHLDVWVSYVDIVHAI